jgi:hypothetical protein
MAIYGRTGDVVTVVRRAVLEDVKRLDGRKPAEDCFCAADHGREVR